MTDTTTCPDCGTPTAEASDFCAGCGKPAGNATTPPQDATATPEMAAPAETGMVPMPATPAPVAANGPTVVSGRPIGEIRSSLAVILLSIVTLGIYALYWYFKNFEDLKQYRGQGVGGGIGLLLAIFLAPVNLFLLPSEVGNLYREDGVAPPVTGVTGCWIFLPFIGGIVWLVKTQGALNRFWQSKGAQA